MAQLHNKVPAGYRLTVGRTRGTVRLELAEAPEGTTLILRPVPVPAAVARYHPQVRAVRDRREILEVSKESLPRAMRILHGLFTEAEARGVTVTAVAPSPHTAGRDVWTATDGHFTLSSGDFACTVRLKEQGVQAQRSWERHNPIHHDRFGTPITRGRPKGPIDTEATGKLTLSMAGYVRGQQRASSWSDQQRWTLEDKLPDLLAEFEVRVAEHVHEQAAAAQRLVDREQQWQAAMDRARADYLESFQVEALRAQVVRWREAEEIRAFCDAAETCSDDVEVTGWVEWARGYADRLCPSPLRPTVAPPPAEVSSADLQPYLRGWSAHGPHVR